MIDANAWDWWVEANERRQILISRKHAIGLMPQEEPELAVLQGLAELVMEAAGPPPLDGPIPELSKADQEALDRLECQACHLPGMKNGVCLFGHLHRTDDSRGTE